MKMETQHTKVCEAHCRQFLKGKFAALSAYFKKFSRSQINNLVVHLKALKKQEQTLFQNSKWEEIIKIGPEV